jgi:hypothetical protein
VADGLVSFCSVSNPILLLLLGVISAEGVIVAGANGGSDNSNNTNAAQLNAAVGTPFINFDNNIKYSDSSGVYLGFNPATNDVWVLSANHVGATSSGSSLSLDGLTFTQVGSAVAIGSSDLRLIKYHNASDLVPGIAPVKLASTAPTISTEVVMIGWGVDRVEVGATGPTDDDSSLVTGGTGNGYIWRANTAGNRFLRWGTNNVDTDVYEVSTGNMGWFADFDMPGAGEWTSSNEAAAAVRDSGSGAYFLSGGEWVLGGVAHGVASAGLRSPFTDPSGDEEGTFYTDVAHYKGMIDLEIGATLIPEPTTGALMLTIVPLLYRRRR